MRCFWPGLCPFSPRAVQLASSCANKLGLQRRGGTAALAEGWSSLVSSGHLALPLPPNHVPFLSQVSLGPRCPHSLCFPGVHAEGTAAAGASTELGVLLPTLQPGRDVSSSAPVPGAGMPAPGPGPAVVSWRPQARATLGCTRASLGLTTQAPGSCLPRVSAP